MAELTKADGGPAFPAPVDVKTDMSLRDVTSGMSQRDWFAGQALAGLLAAGNKTGGNITINNVEVSYDRAAYLMADAMLAARASAQGPK